MRASIAWRAGWVAAAVLLLAAGCSKPFLGVPEWKTLYYQDVDPQTPYRGVPKMTAVRSVEYGQYVALLRQGRVVADERRGDTVYFAVNQWHRVPGGPGADGDASGALVVVTQRYKTTRPPTPTPVSPARVQPAPPKMAKPPPPPKMPKPVAPKTVEPAKTPPATPK